jgi:hypothetical protein
MRMRYATLVDHFHLTLEEVANLTDGQINKIYFHPRDENGGIKGASVMGEEVQPTLEGNLAHLDVLIAKRMVPAEKREEFREKIKERWNGQTRSE